jgi:hypothetical protein
MAFDHAEWKRRLAEVLKEHPDIGKATGMLEVNLGEGGITKIYLDKKIRNSLEAAAWFDHLKEKAENITVRIVIG